MHVCRDKSKLVVIKLCRDKIMFVASKVLSRQAYFCRDKRRVATKMILAAAPADDNQIALIHPLAGIHRTLSGRQIVHGLHAAFSKLVKGITIQYIIPVYSYTKTTNQNKEEEGH